MKSEPTLLTQKFVAEGGGQNKQRIKYQAIPSQNLLGSSGSIC